MGLARAAVERFRLSASVIGAKQSGRRQEAVTEGLDESRLFLLFAADEQRVACLAMDPGLVAAVIQKQTIGEVSPDPPPVRKFTDTDAAIVAPLVEEMLARGAQLVEEPEDKARLSGYEFLSRASGLRAVSLALVQDVYDVFDLTVELEGGVRQGVVSLLLPPQSAKPDSHEEQGAEGGAKLADASGVLRAELTAVIAQMHLPLSELSALTEGKVLPLSNARLDRIAMQAIDRTRVATGRLGQCGGMRAVRLNEAHASKGVGDAPEFSVQKGSRVSVAEPSHDANEPPAKEKGTRLSDPVGGTSNLDALATDQIASEISELAGLSAPQAELK
ncbi:surface presentation of antigens protein [Ruegeria lacuscaerulensis ITI-1157]|nr:surface presentation of antigens protein [Ruegeria lacuscaerulensis ITI-1157]